MDENICIWRTVFFIQMYDCSKITSTLIKFFGGSSQENRLTVANIEIAIEKADDLFQLNVISDDEWPCDQNIQAYYLHSDSLHEIGIKETVYHRACERDLDALTSFVHEACHWAAIKFLGLSVLGEFTDLRKQFHENVVDFLTALLMLHMPELAEKSASEIKGIKSCPMSLALFYSQNHKLFENNFVENILPSLKKLAVRHEKKKEVG